MADYHCPTVVQPNIPLAAMTVLELTVLSQMLESERDGDAVYFFASDSVNDTVRLDAAALRADLDAGREATSILAEIVSEALQTGDPDDEEIELDLSDLGEARIFQDIVRRCDGLDAVTIVSAWTCSRMRPDGFGGCVTIVTADHILSSSTAQMEGELLDRAHYGEVGCAPGHGSHVLLRLDEAEVRRIVDDDAAARGIGASDVTDEDIRAACLTVQPSIDLRNQAIAEATFTALRAAARRYETAR